MIWFFWDGGISPTRLRIMNDCIKSTMHFNPDRKVVLVSNTIQQEQVPCEVRKWDLSLFEGTPISPDLFKRCYIDAPVCDIRMISDIVRMVLLWKYGGSYIDSDDLCIKKMSDTKNMVCRSYDPHTCFYNQIKDEDCISGKWREIRGYDHIPMFPRNDCWQNFEPENPFLTDLLTDPRIQNNTKPIGICDGFSWQSLTMEYLKKHLPMHDVTFALTLAYLYEGHVSVSSVWDRGAYGGEFVDFWKSLPNQGEPWGQYKCTQSTAMTVLNKLREYPNVSHLWLHDKDGNPDWLKADLSEKELVSTWIINEIRGIINEV